MTQITGATSQAEQPFFRYDLQTTAIEEGGNRYVDVTAPDGGESFRFYEVEYAVACGMDGERDVASIVRWAKRELDLQTTSDEVAAIVAKLAELNYIEGVQTAETPDGFELGTSGKATIRTARPKHPTAAEDLELGFAGRAERPAAHPSSPIDSEFELGVAGNEGAAPVDEVESAAEVAAAEVAAAEVAAAESAADKVITAAELPDGAAAAVVAAESATPELVAEISDISDSIAAEAAPEVAAGNEAIAIADSAENQAKREAKKEALAKEEALAKARAARRPIIHRSASIVLWLILLGAVALGAYYYFFHTPYVLEHPADQPIGQTAPSLPPAPQAATEFAAPSTITVTDIPAEEALAARAGAVEWVADPGSQVSAGDTILKIRGSSRLVAAVDKETTSLETYQLKLETAVAREDAASKIANLEANVARKQRDLDAAKSKLAPFIVTSPIDGVVEVLVKARDKVVVDQAIGKVSGTSKTIAVFTLAEGNSAAEDEEYVVASVSGAELKMTCRVTTVEGQKVTLLCPSDAGIEADAAVKLIAP